MSNVLICGLLVSVCFSEKILSTINMMPGQTKRGTPASLPPPSYIYIVKTRKSNTYLLLQIHFGNYCKMTRCD
eukprot:UN22288